MDSYLSGDSRKFRRPNVSSWVIWGAVKKSGSEILIKEEKWQHIDPYISIFWALPINHYFYSLYALWGFLILSHTTKISPSEKGCWALDQNSMWGIVQLLNSKIKTILEKERWPQDLARGRALDEVAIPCGWLFGFSFSFSLVRLLNN